MAIWHTYIYEYSPDSKIIFLLFLFLIPPPLILAEPQDTQQEIKTDWPYVI
jgi:hypothetical protein